MSPILIDCDGVLSHFTRACFALAERVGVHATDEDVAEWDTAKCIGYPGLNDAITRAILRDELVYRMPEYPGAIAWLRSLEAEHGADNVFVCTSPWNAEWLSQRAAWLEKRGVPLQRQIQCSAKHLVPGLLVDDRPGVHLTRTDGATFCLARPWNKGDGAPRGDYADASAWLRMRRPSSHGETK